MPEFTEPRRRKPKPEKPPKPARVPKESKAPKIQKKPKPKTGMNGSVRSQRAQKPPRAKKPKQRRRQNMAIYYVMFFLVTATIMAILSATVLFNLEEIAVEGESIYTSREIIDVSGIHAGVNLPRFNAEYSRFRIINSLVYIDDVVIKKAIFSNRITITVIGAIEMAGIAHEGLFYTISRNGRILETTRTNRTNIAVYGFEADEPIVGGYIRSTEDRKTELVFILIKAAEDAGLIGIVDIDITDHLDIKMNYMDRIILHIGPAAELEQKLRAAAHILENEIAGNEQGTLLLLNPLQVVFSPE
ncbi:MAG: FtsQ-type POTRA domain-containing protein [Oscillospiraceae bacterium]|jgi:cell division protein FtsQ|nr:FtsQ-type POTRA domain-containing protein [Oscillospiraceae bacterium]